jgi:hypothetical protein
MAYFKAPTPWRRAFSGQRWTREGVPFEVCLNDTGRTFRLMRRAPDGELRDFSYFKRVRSLEAAQNIADALAHKYRNRTHEHP